MTEIRLASTSAATPANGDTLVYNSTTGLYEPGSAASAPPVEVIVSTEADVSGLEFQVFPGADWTTGYGQCSSGPIKATAGMKFMAGLSFRSPVNVTVTYIEMLISNAAGTQSMILYNAADWAVGAGGFTFLADADFSAPASVAGTDLVAADDSGVYKVHTVAGGVFWISCMVQIGLT